MREPIPLSRRRLDWLFIGFWILNLGLITYIVDLEQIVIDDPANFEYPIWPPAPLVDMVHWWGSNFDPVQWARPPWWRATIWIDALLFGPFYVAAIYAYGKGHEWIKNPSLIWCGLMFANVTIILFEEFLGATPAKAPTLVLFANLPWLLMPIATAARMWSAHPFTRAAAQAEPTRHFRRRRSSSLDRSSPWTQPHPAPKRSPFATA
jgi:hypothetical protein